MDFRMILLGAILPYLDYMYTEAQNNEAVVNIGVLNTTNIDYYEYSSTSEENLDLSSFHSLESAVSPVFPTNYSAFLNKSGEIWNDTEMNINQLISSFKTKYPVLLWCTRGLFDEDYLLLINKHWLRFDPPNPTSHYVLAALYIAIFIIGVSGNFLVIFMFIRCKSLRTSANILVMNLAISDFFMIVKTPIFVYNSILRGPALGSVGCQVYGFVGGLTGTVSITTLSAIALDRYFVITYPLNPLKSITKIRAKFYVLSVWCYGLLFSSLPLFGINKYVPEGYLTSCSFDYLSGEYNDKLFIFVFFVAAWCVPFSIIAFCYINICLIVIKANNMKPVNSQESSRHFKENEKRKREVKLGLIVIGVVSLWFVSWTPYAVVALLGMFGQNQLVTPLLTMIPALFCKTASCIDPFVYAVCHPRFRYELKALFPCFMTRSQLVMTRAAISFRSSNLRNTVVCESIERNGIIKKHLQGTVKADIVALDSEEEEEEIVMLALKTTVVSKTEANDSKLRNLTESDSSISTQDEDNVSRKSNVSVLKMNEHSTDVNRTNTENESSAMFSRIFQEQENWKDKDLFGLEEIRRSFPLLGHRAQVSTVQKSSNTLARHILTRSSLHVKSKMKHVRQEIMTERESM